MTVLLYCEIGAHAKCSIRGCSCPCHGVRQASGDLRPVDRRPPSPEPQPQIKEPTRVTDTIAEAARVLETRIAEIDRHLAQFDDIRAERKKLEGALRKLRPSAKRPKPSSAATTAGGGSTGERIIAIIATDPNAEWSLTDLISELELGGWNTTSANPRSVIQPTCDKLAHRGEIKKLRAGIYKAAA